MAGDTTITLIGNLTADPELRFTPSGAAVANFTVASTPRTFDRQTNEWKDGETLFMRCSVWRDMAENVSESLSRGMRVIVSGRLKQRSYDTKEGEKRTIVEMDVDEIGPSLRSASATVKKIQRANPAAAPGYSQQQGGNWDGMNDPWTTGGPPHQGNVVDPSQGPQWPAPPAERGGPPPWSGTVPPGQVRPGTWTPDEPPFFAPPTVIS